MKSGCPRRQRDSASEPGAAPPPRRAFVSGTHVSPASRPPSCPLPTRAPPRARCGRRLDAGAGALFPAAPLLRPISTELHFPKPRLEVARRRGDLVSRRNVHRGSRIFDAPGDSTAPCAPSGATVATTPDEALWPSQLGSQFGRASAWSEVGSLAGLGPLFGIPRSLARSPSRPPPLPRPLARVRALVGLVGLVGREAQPRGSHPLPRSPLHAREPARSSLLARACSLGRAPGGPPTTPASTVLPFLSQIFQPE